MTFMLITLDKDQAEDFPSLAAATNAARLDAMRRHGNAPRAILTWTFVSGGEWTADDGFYRVVCA